MRKIFSLAGLLLGASLSVANAQTAALGAQFGNQPGATTGSGLAQCSDWNALPYAQCTWPIGSIKGFAGTFTVKRANIEVLLQLFCGGVPVWMGEIYQGTTPISVMGLPPGIVWPCYFAWQENNNTGSFQPNGDFEYQLVIYSGP